MSANSNLIANRTPCEHGVNCYRKNLDHFKAFSHPPNLKDPISNSISVLFDRNESDMYLTEKIPCPYGAKCYRKNPDHLALYSHPPKSENSMSLPEPQNPILSLKPKNPVSLLDSEDKPPVSDETKQKHLELVEKRFLDSIADLENKNKYLEAEMEKLRIEKMKIAMYHQQLENALAEEVNERERREIKKQQIVEIRGAPPSYWGTNAFEESFREINIRSDSSEFSIISQLLNDTIEIHDNKYGTIYKKNPTEFIITKITRIHSKKLWHEYCFKKETIMQKNECGLDNCESSTYLKDHPLLTPLLDANANEYWLFHGCDKEILPILLNAGYDPRVSSLDGMFGGGFYLAENSSKSNQYIPCPGCKKNAILRGEGCSCKDQENLEFSIILYRAVLGDVHIAKQYNQTKYRGDKTRVRRPPPKANPIHLYDSVMGESIKHGGDSLKYREFILYEPGQAYPEYVINYKRSAVNARAPSDIKAMKDKCYFFLKNRFNLRRE